MGGHGDGHVYKIPSPDIYKIEDCPTLVKYQERLAKEGLKDPWLRNEVWRFHPKNGTPLSNSVLILRGWKLGIPLFLLHIGYNHFFATGKDDHHGEDEHH